jgi:hypothetical protein
MKILSNDHIYEGTPEEIVKQLNDTSLAHAKTDKMYREESADRATMISGQDVRFDTAEHYLMDLSKAGLIKILEDK